MQEALRARDGGDRPTLLELLEEVFNLSAGLGILLLPLLATAVPGVLLFLVAPAVLVLAAVAVPVAIAAAILAPPYLLLRSAGRRLRGGR